MAGSNQPQHSFRNDQENILKKKKRQIHGTIPQGGGSREESTDPHRQGLTSKTRARLGATTRQHDICWTDKLLHGALGKGQCVGDIRFRGIQVIQLLGPRGELGGRNWQLQVIKPEKLHICRRRTRYKEDDVPWCTWFAAKHKGVQ